MKPACGSPVQCAGSWRCMAGRCLPIEVAGIKAGNKTYGHRVMGNGKAITVSRSFDPTADC